MTSFKKNFKKEKVDYFNEKYINRFIAQKKNNNWSEYRNKDNSRFLIREKDVRHIGTKNVYSPIKGQHNVNLQESRGIGISENESLENIIEKVTGQINTIIESDKVRIEELELLIKQNNLNLKDKNFLEIGFRIPKIQSYYRIHHEMNDFGIDINKFNVELFQEMGFSCFHLNLMDNLDIASELKNKFDLICCYHVLEHITNPDDAIENIYNSLNTGGIFHVEIPIEPGVPRLDYGHLISYEPRDMFKLLQGTGFTVISGTNKTHTDGPHIERYIAVKEG